MTIDDTIKASVVAAVAPLVAEVEHLAAEVARLREALPPQLVSIEDAAERLGLSGRTVRRRVRDGSIPVRRVGRRVLVDLGALRPLTGEEIAAEARDARGTR